MSSGAPAFGTAALLLASLLGAGPTAPAGLAQGEAGTSASEPARARKPSPGSRLTQHVAGRLPVGTRVEVKGKFAADGSFQADEIEVRREADRDEELRGLVEAVDPEARYLRILGFSVRVDPDASLTREPGGPARFEDLAPGLRIKVDGRRAADGSFVAEKIRIRERQYPENKIVGAVEGIEAVSRGTVVLCVLGLDVAVNEATDFVDGGRTGRPIVPRRIGVIDDDDLTFIERNRPGGRLAIAGEFRLQAEVLSNPDLDRGTGDGETVPEISGIVGVAADLGAAFLYAEVVGEAEYIVRGDDDDEEEAEGDVRLGEAYVELSRLPVPRLSMAAGRQKFNEEREWYYNNKNLDAVRFFADLHPFTLQYSLSRDLFDESRHLRDQELVNSIAQVTYEPHRDLTLEAFYLRRDIAGEEDPNILSESPEIIGVRALGDAGRHMEFWADLAYEGGGRERRDPSTGRAIVREVRAHAFDVGVTLRPRVALDPTFTAVLARGSGDRPGGRDETFRQSGLQRNRDSWNGVVSFRYYGEVLDPELSNLRILTLGAGIRPIKSFSVDLIFHRYRQDVALGRSAPDPHDDDLHTEIDADATGLDPDIGREWDLVVGYEPSRRVELRLTAGRFEPGGAFDEATPATVVTFRSKFRF